MSSISPAEPGAARTERLSLGGGLLVGFVCLLVSLGALFVVASLIRHGKLPPELKYDADARGLVVE